MTSKPTDKPTEAGSGAAAPAFDFGALKAMLQDTVRDAVAPLQADLASLQARVANQEKMQPRFITNKPERPGGDLRQTLQDMAIGEEREGTKGRIPILPNGKPLPKTVLEMMRPEFENGDPIRLNLALERVPSVNGKPPKTWGDICQTMNCDGSGHIVRRLDVLTFGGWLYHVHIDGIHAKGKFQGITEDQLLAAS